VRWCNALPGDHWTNLQSTPYRVHKTFKRNPYLAGVKAALSLHGFDAGPLRHPLHGMSNKQWNELEIRLWELDVLWRDRLRGYSLLVATHTNDLQKRCHRYAVEFLDAALVH
jgi:hypothetical protein